MMDALVLLKNRDHLQTKSLFHEESLIFCELSPNGRPPCAHRHSEVKAWLEETPQIPNPFHPLPRFLDEKMAERCSGD
jgi:hypothetical protein